MQDGVAGTVSGRTGTGRLLATVVLALPAKWPLINTPVFLA